MCSALSLPELPPELLVHICTFLSPEALSALSQTCRSLREFAGDDLLWKKLVQANLPGCHLDHPGRAKSFRELFTWHYPRWFVPKHKIWIGDQMHCGSLLVARYDPKSNGIEACKLVAERGDSSFALWPDDMSVQVSSFAPRVNLHRDKPVVRLLPAPDSPSGLHPMTPLLRDSETAETNEYGDDPQIAPTLELPMAAPRPPDGIYSNFMLARRLPVATPALQPPPGTRELWPPLTIPAPERVPSSPLGETIGKDPQARGYSQYVETAFRVRKWMEFGRGREEMWIRMGEDVTTYATIPPELYTPTEDKPWRGIWVGDYLPHGCEFLLVLQSDDDDDGPMSGDVSDDTDSVYRGELRAIKLTGDPNVPRGQCTFVAEDIGPDGLVRIAEEEPFQGCRIVKSKGHVAGAEFTNDCYLDSELIMISHDQLAHLWIALGHINYYNRVDIDKFIRAEDDETDFDSTD